MVTYEPKRSTLATTSKSSWDFNVENQPVDVALLTAGQDKPYALGLASALVEEGVMVEFIGSDEVNGPELHKQPGLKFLNFRGDQQRKAALYKKMFRVLRYYARLIWYTASAKPPIFHILWNDKCVVFERTLMMLYYRLAGRKIVFTAHNVNAGKRDATDTLLNRLSLWTQYQLAHCTFVHTKRMKDELIRDFGVTPKKVSVIPFGINNTVPNTRLTSLEAKQELGFAPDDKVVLFFGNIAPYKGLEFLVEAMAEVCRKDKRYRLVIAGAPKDNAEYWAGIERKIHNSGFSSQVIARTEFIPDAETELYFKAADVLALPYTEIFQSGVLFLGYSFGLPVIATDVGSLKDDVIAGITGFVCQPKDASSLAKSIEAFFASDLYGSLEQHRGQIRDFANKKYSWTEVAQITKNVYAGLLGS